MEKIQVKSIDEGLTAKKQLPINLMMKNRLGAKWILIIILSFIFGGLGGVLADRYLFPYFLTLPQFEKYKFLQPKETKIVIKKEEAKKVEETGNIPDLAKKIRPYVVGIAPAEDLKNFFGHLSPLKSGGQGVILTSDGIILTTKSAVSKATNVMVVFSDGKNYETNKIFSDPVSDLVFLKIKADNLPAVELSNLDDIFLGQKVFIFGNLFLEESNNLTQGIVENDNKIDAFSIQEENLDSFLQIQADLGKYSYGAPIFDFNNKMIGMVSKINGQKILAIAAFDIQKPLSDMAKNSKISRVKLGIKYFPVTTDFSYFKNLKKSQGIFLPQYAVKNAVEKKGPADRAGILPGDLIYGLDGQEIRGKDTYFRLLQRKNNGEEIEISYLRKDKEYKTKAILEER